MDSKYIIHQKVFMLISNTAIAGYDDGETSAEYDYDDLSQNLGAGELRVV